MTCLGFLNLTLNAIPTAILLLTKVEHIDWGYVPWGYMCGGAVLSLGNSFYCKATRFSIQFSAELWRRSSEPISAINWNASGNPN